MSTNPASSATEQHVYDKLEARDKDMVDSFVEHCELWLSSDHTKPLLLAIIELDDRHWLFLRSTIAQLCPDLCAALDQIINHIEKHRAEFIECESERLIKEASEEV